MRVAVYAIALNEAKHVERWYASTREADCHVLLDTGSTDATLEIAQRLGIITRREVFTPFDFAKARNAALALVPEDVDYCITLDLDEILHPGWRDAFDELPPNTTRPRFRYIYNREADGSEGMTYAHHATHHRHGYEWRGSIHESIVRKPDAGPEVEAWCEAVGEHKPDTTKSRAQYLTMLKRAVEAEPECPRQAYYHARELLIHKRDAEAVAEFKRYLRLKSPHLAERSTAHRYLASLEPHHAEQHLLRACADAPDRREPWVDLAHLHYTRGAWAESYAAATRAITITTKPLGYFCEAAAWGARPFDLAALAAHHLGLREEAVKHGRTAVSLDPADGRLQTNLAYYEDALRATVDATLVTH